MTALERIAQSQGALKVFPLPGAVLFPHTMLPLNIFEPRYVELVHDCLQGDRVMAISGLLPGWQSDYGGRPPLSPLLCAATIAWHEHHPDGRYTVLLQGVTRARLIRELAPRKLYRELEVELLPDPSTTYPEEELLRQAALELAGKVPAFAEDFLQIISHTSGGALADVVAGGVIEDAELRQSLLEELDPRKRLRRVLDELSGIVASIVPAPPTGLLN